MKIKVPFFFSLLLLIACWNGQTSPTPQIATGPSIDIWYGLKQSFGHRGTPQRWVNILGNVQSEAGLSSLIAVLNQKDTFRLTTGPDGRRLARAGDFNVDIDRQLLQIGKNILHIQATDSLKHATQVPIEIQYRADTTWPLPYAVDWQQVKEIQKVVEVTDGKWEIVPAGIKTTEPYYDRVLAFGDSTWQNYEVSTTVIFHSFSPPEKGPPTFGVSHAAIATYWPGHDADKNQPHTKWFPLGATAEFRLTHQLDSCRWRIFDGQSLYVEKQEEAHLRRIQLEQTYGMKHRVLTQADGKIKYAVKLWPQNESEPDNWDLIAIEEANDGPTSGSALLLAHNTEVTFGNIRVIPLDIKD